MHWKKVFNLVDVHCEGEVGKVVTSGVLDLPGETMLEKMDYINKVDDSIRRFLVFEPRGCAQGSVNLLLPPTEPAADAAFIILQADEAHPMSGSNAICVTTALLETGMVEMSEPVSTVVLETPAGLITATAQCAGGACKSVSIDMPLSFVEQLDVEIDTERWGRLRGDIAYGGCYYAIVDVDQLGLRIEPGAARELVEYGVALKQAFNDATDIAHPEYPSIDHIAYVMFRGKDDDGAVRTCTTLKPGRADRSPCGTGSSANLATLHARGEIAVGGRTTSRSIIGSEFSVELIAEGVVGNRPAVQPRITGRAWVYGTQQIGLDPDDPFPLGYALSDTWGPYLDDL